MRAVDGHFLFSKVERRLFNMARIRTIPKAVAAIKEIDPDTYITAALVRRWVRQGVIKTVDCTSGYQLINLDQLERYLECGANDDS